MSSSNNCDAEKASLQPFYIRDLHSPVQHLGQRDGYISSLQPARYNQIIQEVPTATLSYVDPEDGETITVGSALELGERLQEPTKPSVAFSASQHAVHSFDIQRRDDDATAAWKAVEQELSEQKIRSRARHLKQLALQESRPQGLSQSPGLLSEDSRARHFRLTSPPATAKDAETTPVTAVDPSEKVLTAEGQRRAAQAAQKLRPFGLQDTPVLVRQGSDVYENRWASYGTNSTPFQASKQAQPSHEQQPLLDLFEAELAKLTASIPANNSQETLNRSASLPLETSGVATDHRPLDAPGQVFAGTLKSLFDGLGNLTSSILHTAPHLENSVENALRGSADALKVIANRTDSVRTLEKRKSFEAERILAKRTICYDGPNAPKITQYLVRWAGQTEADDVWYDAENLSSCQNLIDAYEARSGMGSSQGEEVDFSTIHCRTAGDRTITFKRQVDEDTQEAQHVVGPVTFRSLRRRPQQDRSSMAEPRRVRSLANVCGNGAAVRERVATSASSANCVAGHPVAGPAPAALNRDNERSAFSFSPAEVLARYPPVSQLERANTSVGSRIRKARSQAFEVPVDRETRSFLDVSEASSSRAAGEVQRRVAAKARPQSLWAGSVPNEVVRQEKIQQCIDSLAGMGYRYADVHAVATATDGDLQKTLDHLEEDEKAWRQKRSSDLGSTRRYF